MKRVLIITYYWPPAGGSGVQRWLKFAKYLPHNGWQPIIYCPENADYTVLDESLAKDIPSEAEVIKGAIFEPYRFFRKITGQKEVIGTGLSSTGGKPNDGGFLKKLMIWVRGNMIIPDARMFWIKPSVKRLRKYIEENSVDAIVSTGPPHSCHLIALGLKKHFPDIKWIADFRDPWSTIDFMQDLKIGNSAMDKHLRLEKDVLASSDAQIVVTPSMVEEFENLGAKNLHFIANGFDEADYSQLRNPDTSISDSNIFIISHIGTLPPSRNPRAFWEAIKTLEKQSDDTEVRLHLNFIGKVDIQIKNEALELGLENRFKVIEYVPHNEIARIQQSADLLLLIINDSPNAKAILTGKLFEYLASKRPILCIAPLDSDAAKVINETQSGEVFDYDDRDGMVNFIKKSMDNKAAGEIYDNIGISAYARHNLTQKLAQLLNQSQS